jgi:hypothetical protein
MVAVKEKIGQSYNDEGKSVNPVESSSLTVTDRMAVCSTPIGHEAVNRITYKAREENKERKL